MIPNCPVNKADILRAEDIFWANVGSLQGKSVRQKSPRIVTTIHELPTEIMQRHGKVTIEADIMYINGIPFVVTTSHHIHFCTAELIKNEKSTTIATAIKQVIQIYHRRGFKVQFLPGRWAIRTCPQTFRRLRHHNKYNWAKRTRTGN